MGVVPIQSESVSIRLARDENEIRAAQRLRYKVFYQEYGAHADENTARTQLDVDSFDDVADHLVVVDENRGTAEDRIVGTYRLIRRAGAEKIGRFYTSAEYDIAPLLSSGLTLLELGRSCVLAEYRTRPVLQMLWDGLVDYSAEHYVDVMFGCASLHGTDVSALSQQLSYLYHNHLAREDLRPRALENRYVNMNVHTPTQLNAREVIASLPPLIKGYLRVGCVVGDGAVIDHQFNTTDVCIMLETKNMSARYRRHYARKHNLQAMGIDITDEAAEPELVLARGASA